MPLPRNLIYIIQYLLYPIALIGIESNAFNNIENNSTTATEAKYSTNISNLAPHTQKKPLDETLTDKIRFDALRDFTPDKHSAIPYYKHIDKNALAINAANKSYRNGYASATLKHTFENDTPITYDITLITLAETDGESHYRIKLNGHIIAEFTNPETQIDYSETSFTIEDIKLKKGDRVTVASKAVTNFKIPEHDETAYARGRWIALVLQ